MWASCPVYISGPAPGRESKSLSLSAGRGEPWTKLPLAGPAAGSLSIMWESMGLRLLPSASPSKGNVGFSPDVASTAGLMGPGLRHC